jgi:hypothetical protein
VKGEPGHKGGRRAQLGGRGGLRTFNLSHDRKTRLSVLWGGHLGVLGGGLGRSCHLSGGDVAVANRSLVGPKHSSRSFFHARTSRLPRRAQALYSVESHLPWPRDRQRTRLLIHDDAAAMQRRCDGAGAGLAACRRRVGTWQKVR